MRQIAAASRSLDARQLHNGLSSKQFTRLLAGSAALLLSGCNVATPPVVTPPSEKIANGQTISLMPPAKAGEAPELAPQFDPALQIQLHGALRDAFTKRGFAVVDDGTYRVEYSITQRSASVGIAKEPDRGSDAPPQILSPERQNGGVFRECDARRMRIVVMAYPTAGTGPAPRATGEMDDCAFTSEKIDLLVDAIAEQITNG